MADLATEENPVRPDEKQSGGQKPEKGSIKILSPFTIGEKQGIIFGISVDGGASQTSGWKIQSGSNVLVNGRGLEIFNRVSLGVDGAVYPGDNVEVTDSSLSFHIPNELDNLLADGTSVVLLFSDSKNVLNTRPLKQKFVFIHKDTKDSEKGDKKQKEAEELNELNKQPQIVSELINSSIGGPANAFAKGLSSSLVKNRPSSGSVQQNDSLKKDKKDKKDDSDEEAEEDAVDDDGPGVEVDASAEDEISPEMASIIVSEYIDNNVNLIVNPIVRREVTEKLSGKQSGELSVEAKTALKEVIQTGTSDRSSASVEVQEALKMVGDKESSLNLGLTEDTEESVEINPSQSTGQSSVEVEEETDSSLTTQKSEKEKLDVKAKASQNQSAKAKQTLDSSESKQGPGTKKVEGGEQSEDEDVPPNANIEGEQEDEASTELSKTQSIPASQKSAPTETPGPSPIGGENQQPSSAVEPETGSNSKEGEFDEKLKSKAGQVIPKSQPQNTPPPLPKTLESVKSKIKADEIIQGKEETPPSVPNKYSGILDQFKKNDSAAVQKIYGQGQPSEELLGAAGQLPDLVINTAPVNNSVKPTGKSGKKTEQSSISSSSSSEQVSQNNLNKIPQQNVLIDSANEQQEDKQQEDSSDDSEQREDEAEPKPGEEKQDKKNKEKKEEGLDDQGVNQNNLEDQQSQDQDQQQAGQQAEEQVVDELTKSQGFDEVVKMVNLEMNVYLNSVATTIWAAALPTFGLSVIAGAVAGDLIVLLKNWLVKRAIGVVSVTGLSKAIKVSDYSKEEIAKKIKFSSATIVNIVLMNFVSMILIFSVVVGVLAFLKVLCSPVKLVDGLPEVSTIQSVCNVVNKFGEVTSPASSAPGPSATPTPTPSTNLR